MAVSTFYYCDFHVSSIGVPIGAVHNGCSVDIAVATVESAASYVRTVFFAVGSVDEYVSVDIEVSTLSIANTEDNAVNAVKFINEAVCKITTVDRELFLALFVDIGASTVGLVDSSSSFIGSVTNSSIGNTVIFVDSVENIFGKHNSREVIYLRNNRY